MSMSVETWLAQLLRANWPGGAPRGDDFTQAVASTAVELQKTLAEHAQHTERMCAQRDELAVLLRECWEKLHRAPHMKPTELDACVDQATKIRLHFSKVGLVL